MSALDTGPGAAGLAALRPAWLDLWARCGGDPFAHPDWLTAWWSVFAPGPAVTATVWRGRDLVAFAPLYRDPVSRLVLPVGGGPSDRTDVLVDPVATGAGESLAAAIDSAAGEADILWPDVPVDAAILALDPPPGRRRTVVPGAVTLAIDLGQGVGAVPAARWRKWRMAGHRAARRGGLALVDAGSFGPTAFARQLVTLNAARFDPAAGGVFGDPRMAVFVAQALPALAAAGLLDGRVALIGGEVAGVQCGFHAGRRGHAWLGGFDPRFARESPGTLLLGDAVRRAVARGDEALDLLRGAESYKSGWGAAPTRLLQVRWSRTGHG
jgi:CelD/BcsL family acetyltransferase involved in cellulose biosynthesis